MRFLRAKKHGERFKAVQNLKGSYSGRNKKFGIVVSEFNEFLTRRLLEGALDALIRGGAREKDITVVWVPGAFEIPLAAQKLIANKKLNAVITLAVIIRGETKHFDQVAGETAKGLRELAQKTEIPVVLGIIPADTVDQALRRVGLKQVNKGREWGLTALAMADLMPRIGPQGKRR